MALNYLLSPEFQIVNTAGKPATGGYLEVYISGSRERYYCASDFDGTLYPFQVPLDSLGSNVVLADNSHAYDVYIYNRYGSLLMSRYNVHPGAGGGAIGTGDITSSDGSIIVTQTANGVDLRTNSTPPSILRATASTLYTDGQFTFSEAQRDGQNAIVDAQGKIIVNEGWWHYDATVRLRWTGPAQNETQPVSLYTQNASDSMTFDLSYSHSETVQVSGEYKALNDSTQFVLGVTNVPSGMVVDLVDFGVHSIIGEGAGGSYDAGNGIIINEADRIISIDPDVVQEKLTAGNNITIENNVISATAEPQVQADWAQSDITAVDFIKNKPDLSTYATDAELTAGLATKQDTLTAGTGISIDSNNVISSTASDNTFNAIYGVTTLSEIEDAVDAGKAVFVTGIPNEPGKTLPLVVFRPNLNSADFYAYSGTAVYFVALLSSGNWQYTVYGSQADWNEARSYFPAYIKNKPDLSVYATQTDLTTGLATKQDTISDLATIRAGAAAGATAVQDADYVHTDENYTSADKTKLSGIAVGAEVNVQSDWTEADTTADSYIQHKPGQTSLVAGQNITIVDDSQNNTVTISAASVSVPVQDVTIDNVSVVNAQGVAEIPRQVNADWNSSAGASEILNKPSIPVIGTITL